MRVGEALWCGGRPPCGVPCHVRCVMRCKRARCDVPCAVCYAKCGAPCAVRASYSRCGTYFHICCTRETDSVCDSKTITYGWRRVAAWMA